MGLGFTAHIRLSFDSVLLEVRVHQLVVPSVDQPLDDYVGGKAAQHKERGPEERGAQLEEGEVQGGGHEERCQDIVPETEVHALLLDVV